MALSTAPRAARGCNRCWPIVAAIRTWWSGLLLVLLLIASGSSGRISSTSPTRRRPSTIPDQPPSSDLPLGSDDQGRDMLAVLVAGVPLTLRVGFIAGRSGC